MIRIEFLPADNGDCILLTIDKFNILIDGGMGRTYYRVLREKLKTLDKIDLVILTHIDEDHIAGLIELFKDKDIKPKVKKVWFNSVAKLSELFDTKYDKSKEYGTEDDSDKNVSYKQGESLESLLDGINYDLIYLEKQKKYQFENIELTILSPRKKDLKRLHKYWLKDIEERKQKEIDKNINDTVEEYESIEELYSKEFENDTRRANKSSIAFNLKYNHKNYLFLGDANMSVVTKALKDEKIEKLDAELVKLSHHGSKKNINQKVLNIVNSHKFIVSTNGNIHNHPDKEALSRIIKNPKRDKIEIEFWFNYDEDTYPKIFTDDELKSEEYNFKLKFAEEEGIKYEL